MRLYVDLERNERMATRQHGKQSTPQSLSADCGASTGKPSNLGALRPTAAEPTPAAGTERVDGAEPVIVIYESSERDSKTRLQIVQSGFGGAAAWTALVDAWRDTSASFALLAARVFATLGRPAVAALRSSVRGPALSLPLSSALRPVP